MEILISFYDNALIYYPNVFFVASFFISILGIILVNIGIIVLWKKIKRRIEEIKNNLKQIKKIKREERKNISFTHIISVFFQRKSISFIYIIKASTVFFVRMIGVFLIRINTALVRVESRAERIIKKIGKEILIEE